MDSTNSTKKDWIVIEDDFKGYDPEMFNIPELYKGLIDHIMISEGMVSDRLDKVALQVSDKTYRRQKLKIWKCGSKPDCERFGLAQ